jgi:hypothetical protein
MSTNEEKTQQYSTWGDKLLLHTDVLHTIQYDYKFKPITVQLSLCEICDSDCPFCSVAGRPLKSYIPWDKLEKLVRDFASLGAKAVEITGGGNPLLYRDKEAKKNINDVIRLIGSLGLDIGIITNTEKLERHLDPEVYPMINWIRISLIKLDEGKQPEDYDFGSFPPTKLGFSYIIYDSTGGIPDELSRTNKPYVGTTVESIEKIAKLVELNPEVKFCRIAGNCLSSENHIIVKDHWAPIVAEIDKLDKFFVKEIWGKDFAYDHGCYVGLIRPYIAPHPDGGDYQVYICTSHVLTTRTYDLNFSLGSIDKVLEIWDDCNKNYALYGYPYQIKNNEGKGWTEACDKCFYFNNNKLLHTVAQAKNDDDRNFA